ncbi:MAG: Tetratricopeptide (TPR) repeat/Tetratricopeptide (TPR) repeat [Verrucomicrobia bacterium]|nr:MAG: Tetratricopeptide (TPR) repeat/Tetratricopeptide (TPR) repeat [Verrucomicrobiota bacterium]
MDIKRLFLSTRFRAASALRHSVSLSSLSALLLCASAAEGPPRQLVPDALDRFNLSGEEPQLQPEGEGRAQALLYYYRGTKLERSGDVDRALEAYETALGHAPSNLALAEKTAQLAGQYGNPSRGLAILERAHRLNLANPNSYLLLSEYLSTYHENRRENVERSLAVMQEAARQFPANPEVHERLILLHMMRRDQPAAEAALAAALKAEIKDPAYWLEMARVAQRLHPSGEGHVSPEINAIYEKALANSGDDLEIATQVADHYRLTRQLDRAAELYQQIIKKHPEALTVRERLAGVYGLQENLEMVLSTLLDLERINPHRMETQKSIAQLFFKQAQKFDAENRKEDAKAAYANSVTHFLKSFRIAKGEVAEYILVAEMQQYAGQANEAVTLLQRAQFHYPEEIPLAIALAESLSAAKRYPEAIDAFKKTERISQELRPDLLDDRFYFSYGAAVERNKQFDEAANLFRKSIELAPVDSNPQRQARALNYLGYMWLEQNRNLKEAGELIIRANDLMPDEGAFVDSLGWYYFLVKDYKKALIYTLKAGQLMNLNEPENAVVLDHIAQSYFQLGHRDKAISYLERALSMEAGNKDFAKRLEEFRKGPVPEQVPLDFLPADASPAEEPVPEKAPRTAA